MRYRVGRTGGYGITGSGTGSHLRKLHQNVARSPKSIGGPTSLEDLAAGQPIQSSDYDPGRTVLHDPNFISDEGVQSFLAVPLLCGNIFLGLIEVMCRKPRQFSTNEVDLVSRLAHQVVLSIENARLYRQLHHMAAFEERDRLAREFHDNLSQSLGYLKSNLRSPKIY